MSDSEDDFMSDKFLVDTPATTDTSYTARRKRQQLESHRKGQANNKLSLRELEAQRRREGLNKSLFDLDDGDGEEGDVFAAAAASGSSSSKQQQAATTKPKEAGKSKAMDLMMKMGWKVGQGLGRRRSASPERQTSSSTAVDRERDDEDNAPRGGIGASRGRAEPIRISMWAAENALITGRKGLSARSPSPPPLRGRNDPHYLPPGRHAALDSAARSFRGRQGAEQTAKETERKEHKARQLLVDFDKEKEVTFHPLHAEPGDPLSLPRPLLKLIYPAQLTPSPGASRSPSPALEAAPAPSAAALAAAAAARATSAVNMSAAVKLREQMRRDMLAEMEVNNDDGSGRDGDVRFGIPGAKELAAEMAAAKAAKEEEEASAGVHWDEMVSGTKRVLSMTPEEHLAFLVSQLRNEHLFCFWCASKYASFEEMDGPGGCPGEAEDDH